MFAEAFVVNLLNPKVALFFLAFLPQFVERGHGAIWTQTLVLGLVYITLGLCSDSMYVLIGARMGSWMSARSERLREPICRGWNPGWPGRSHACPSASQDQVLTPFAVPLVPRAERDARTDPETILTA